MLCTVSKLLIPFHNVSYNAIITKYYYDSDGYLNSKIERNDQHGEYEELTYTRDCGNVVIYRYDGGGGLTKTYKYTYTDYKDKANIDLMAICGNFFIEYIIKFVYWRRFALPYAAGPFFKAQN